MKNGEATMSNVASIWVRFRHKMLYKCFLSFIKSIDFGFSGFSGILGHLSFFLSPFSYKLID